MSTRVTASDVNLNLQKHEVQCSERWTQNWNRMQKIEKSLEKLDQKMDDKFDKIDLKLTRVTIGGFILYAGAVLTNLFT